MMQKIEISQDELLAAGDIIELHFNTYGPDWLKAVEAAIIERAVDKREEFEIVSTDYWQQDKVIITIRVQKTNPIVVTVAIILAALAGTALAFGWMFEKAYKVTESPAGKIGISSIAIIAGILLFGILRKK